MRPLSAKVKKVIDTDPYYRVCARRSSECDGRLTMEHALLYAGRQVDEAWAIVPLCWHHHLGPGLNKRINKLLAFRRATERDFKKYSKAGWKVEAAWLEHSIGHLAKRQCSPSYSS